MSKPWPVKPEALDIVWCRFPELHGSDGPVPGAKPRPALILDIDDRSTPLAVRVAFGTSKRTDELFSGEFQISPSDGEVFRASGCDGDTKFDLRRAVWLPLDDTWFTAKPNSKSKPPIIGRIDLSKSAAVKARLRAVVTMLAKEQADR